MQHTFLENNKILEALDTVAAGTTDQNGATVDMGQDGGFDSISFGVRMGTIAATAVTSAKLQESADGGTTWTDIADAEITIPANGDDQWFWVEKARVNERHVRGVVDRGTANAAITIGLYVLSRAHKAPFDDATDVTTLVVP